MHSCPLAFAQAPFGRQQHPANQRLARHCHDSAFATIVLEGGYLEAGDEGRRSVNPGDVLIHHAYEYGRVSDPDALVRTALRSPHDAWLALASDMLASEQRHLDWPDLLAEQLRNDNQLCLRQWADSHGLRPETVSRGFQLAYSSSPKAFRAAARARAAVRRIRESRQPLADIAATLGYADQAHMSRSVKALTGQIPRTLRADNAAGAATCTAGPQGPPVSTGFKTTGQTTP